MSVIAWPRLKSDHPSSRWPSQAMTLMINRAYAVSFLVAQRRFANGGINSQTLQVKVGNRVIGDFMPTQTIDGSYVLYTSDAFTVPAVGTYNVVIQGTNTQGGDNTALIDQVTVTGGLVLTRRTGRVLKVKVRSPRNG